MKTKRLLLLPALLLALSVGNVACSYHNDDNPNEYPDLEPEPEPEPEPGPGIDRKYLEAAYTPNCFMVKPGQSIDIPILKAYAMWDLYAEWLGGEDFTELTPEPVLLWQDLPGLITNVGLIPGQQAEEGSIAVSTADKVGNAVIGIRIGGAVRWSWHIWVTRYDPDAELVAYGKIYTWDNDGDGIKDYTFMDRNLGATIDKAVIEKTAADSLAACGLMYQWGRKDPFPGDRILRGTNTTDSHHFDSKPIYDMAGVQLTEGSQAEGTGIHSIKTDADPTRTGLAKSIVEPMVYLRGTEGYSDWFCCSEPTEMKRCDTLWCEPVRGKSPFDPCPEGWRVPADKNGEFIWNGLENATTDYSALGVFPYAGFRYCAGGGCLKNSGFGASIWSGTPPAGIGNAYELTIYIASYNQRPNIRRDISSRSDGQSVRCAEDERHNETL